MAWAAIYALVMPLVIGLMTSRDSWASSNVPNMAAWVQAYGPIGAIVASAGIAIGVNWAERRHQREDKKSARVELLQMLCDLADDAVAGAQSVRKTISDDLQAVFHNGVPDVANLNETAALLEQIDVRSLNSAAAHRCWMRLLHHCRAGSFWEDRAVRSWQSDGHLDPDSEEALDSWPDSVAALRDQLNRMRDQVHRGVAISAIPSSAAKRA